MASDKNMRAKAILLDVVSGLGQILVALAAVSGWYIFMNVQARWFLFGAALWAIAVALKMLCASLTNKPAIEILHARLPYTGMVISGGLLTGIQSSLFEMGLTWVAVWIWPALGRGAARAIAVGIGAGAIEAFLLGAAGLIGGLVRLSAKYQEPLSGEAAIRLFWLLAPVERTIALLCHAACRALILLGAVHANYSMVFWGFSIFTLLDGTAGAAHISGKLKTVSFWWIELALSPFAIVSIPILVWCYENYKL